MPIPNPPSTDGLVASTPSGSNPSTCTARLHAIAPALVDDVGCIAADRRATLRSAKWMVVAMAAVVNGVVMSALYGGAVADDSVDGGRVDGVDVLIDVDGLDGGVMAHLAVNGGANGGACGGMMVISGTQAEHWTVANEIDWPATLAASNYSEIWTEDLVVDLLVLAAYNNIPDQPEFITASTMEPDIITEFCFAAQTPAISCWTWQREYDVMKAPNSYHEAVNRSNTATWKDAMDHKMQGMSDMNAFEEVNLPAGRKTIGLIWKYTIKCDTDGKHALGKEKARLVAQGFSQHPEDYDETYAPVAKMVSIRILLAYATAEDLEIRQFDCKTAFLHMKNSKVMYGTKYLVIPTKTRRRYSRPLLRSMVSVVLPTSSTWYYFPYSLV